MRPSQLFILTIVGRLGKADAVMVQGNRT